MARLKDMTLVPLFFFRKNQNLFSNMALRCVPLKIKRVSDCGLVKIKKDACLLWVSCRTHDDVIIIMYILFTTTKQHIVRYLYIVNGTSFWDQIPDRYNN